MIADDKEPLYNVYMDKLGQTDVKFVAKETLSPRLLNRSLTSIKVRYRQYLRDVRKNVKLDSMKTIEKQDKDIKIISGSVNNATITESK